MASQKVLKLKSLLKPRHQQRKGPQRHHLPECANMHVLQDISRPPHSSETYYQSLCYSWFMIMLLTIIKHWNDRQRIFVAELRLHALPPPIEKAPKPPIRWTHVAGIANISCNCGGAHGFPAFEHTIHCFDNHGTHGLVDIPQMDITWKLRVCQIYLSQRLQGGNTRTHVWLQLEPVWCLIMTMNMRMLVKYPGHVKS